MAERRRWWRVARLAAVVVGVCMPGRAVLAQRNVSYDILSLPAFPTAVVANFGTGVTPGFLLNSGAPGGYQLDSQASRVGQARTVLVEWRASAATTTGPAAKPASDVQVCWSAACTWTPLRTTFQTLHTRTWASGATPSSLLGNFVLVRIALRWEVDVPGTYSLGVESRLTITSP